MSRRPNDIIGKTAGLVLINVAIAVALGGYGYVQTQDAIDEALAQQQALACFQHARMCAAVDKSK